MIEDIIFVSLVSNEKYSREVLPHLKEEYFPENVDKVIFKLISSFITKYNKLPTKQTLLIDLEKVEKLNENEFEKISSKIKSLKKEEKTYEWLIDTTEEFCKNKAIYNALVDSIDIVDGNNKNETKDSIPDILIKALGISFDTTIGHDWYNDYKARFEFYKQKQDKIEFDLDIFNKITKGGLLPKTLTLVVAPTGVGKSLIMCHMAARNYLNNKNALYISMEMGEEQISQRIDANLLGININEIEEMSWDSFDKKMKRVSSKTTGKIVVKEFPTGGASAANFRHLIKELQLKKNFTPDIIYVDYLNICASSRKRGGTHNSYEYMKSVAEELRALAVEFNLPLVTATQTNRDGIGNNDIDLKNTSESIGIVQAADLVFTLIATDELTELNQIMIKQLKNRYNDLNYYNKFVVGLDRAKMTFFNLEDSVQEDSFKGSVDDKPVFDSSHAGRRMFEDDRGNKKFGELR